VTVPDVYTRTLIRAADIVGGELELALRLKVTPSHLHLWIRGMSTPPLDVFLSAVDIVVANDQALRPGAAPPQDVARNG
jgi:hypothetical protein